MPGLRCPNLLQKIPVLPSCGQQRQGTQGNQAHSQIARRLRAPNITAGNFFGLVLEELVNAEAESDHRNGGSNPCHQRSFRGDDRALKGQIGSLFGKDRSPIFCRCVNRAHETFRRREGVCWSCLRRASIIRATRMAGPRRITYGTIARVKATMSASPGYTKCRTMSWYTTSSTTARMNTLPMRFHASLTMSTRWGGFETSSQNHGGLPALASARPARIAKNAAMHGWSTNLNFIGPLTRASNCVPTRINMLSIMSPSFYRAEHDTTSTQPPFFFRRRFKHACAGRRRVQQSPPLSGLRRARRAARSTASARGQRTRGRRTQTAPRSA